MGNLFQTTRWTLIAADEMNKWLRASETFVWRPVCTLSRPFATAGSTPRP